jgi:poly(glycerol-phosphate) alpha-glucosyltransferase
MDSVSRVNGGIFEAERRLQQTLAEEHRVSVEVLGLQDKFSLEDRRAWLPLSPKVFRIRGPAAFGYSAGLRRAVVSAKADAVYCAGLWKYHSLLSLQWARKTRKPLLVAPHGMLDDWAVKQSRGRKRLARLLYQDAQLETASCIRALCDAEARAIRKNGIRSPVCIIPNGIDLPSDDCDSGSAPELSELRRLAAGRKVLLYLGRIHPKKGLVDLLRAWRRMLDDKSPVARHWILVIAGWSQGEHEAVLKMLAADLGLSSKNLASGGAESGSVHFLGPQFGEAKTACFRDCDAFIIPSLSEGLPMVVLEAWAWHKPVLMTPACNLPEAFVANAAIRIEPSAERICTGLRQMLEMSTSELRTIAGAGYRLASARYAWSRVAEQMNAVIEWVAGQAPKPDVVVNY